jgi:nitrate/nitrite-specific signal transduction histidine kinase
VAAAPRAPLRDAARSVRHGLGFVPGSQPGPESAHFGIQGMRERAEMLGGTLAIESAPGRGTMVTVRVPCPEPVAAEEEP